METGSISRGRGLLLLGERGAVVNRAVLFASPACEQQQRGRVVVNWGGGSWFNDVAKRFPTK